MEQAFLTERCEGGDEGEGDNVVVLAPQSPATVHQDALSNKVGHRDEDVCTKSGVGLICVSIDPCRSLRVNRRRDHQWANVRWNNTEESYQSCIELIEGDSEMRCSTRKQEAVREEDESVHGNGPDRAAHRDDEDDTVDSYVSNDKLALTVPKTSKQAKVSLPYNTASQAKPMREAKSEVRIMVGSVQREAHIQPRVYEASRKRAVHTWVPVTWNRKLSCFHAKRQHNSTH